MSVAVMLDQCLLPERGAVQLKLDRSFDINISAEEARRKVNHWVLTEVSCVMGAMTPTLIVGEEVVWRVPIELTAPHMGHVGIAGTVDVNVQSGVMAITGEDQEKLLLEARALVKKMPPYRPRGKADLSADFIVTNLSPSILGPQGIPREIIAVIRHNLTTV